MPVTYPVDPTTRAVMRSVTPLFFTTSVCAPEVVPASPVTVELAPSCLATDAKCTPLVPTAFRAALYSAVAAASPALGGGGRAGGTGGGRRGGEGQCGARRRVPAATAAVRAGFWRKGCMTFTLLEARHGGAASADLARG